MSPGRNEQCHCGSGKKYKHCHYDADHSRNAAGQRPQVSEHHVLDEELVVKINRYLAGRFERDFHDIADALETFPEINAQLIFPWLAYVTAINGRRGVEWFLDDHASSLSRRSRSWLEL